MDLHVLKAENIWSGRIVFIWKILFLIAIDTSQEVYAVPLQLDQIFSITRGSS